MIDSNAFAHQSLDPEQTILHELTMNFARIFCLTWTCVIVATTTRAEDTPAADLTLASRQHMALSQQPTGLLIPLYLYPADIHTNTTYNRLIALKLAHPRVPICVILDPADGPGKQLDGNYKQAALRLSGAGCVVLGYVSTRYAKQPLSEVKADIDKWGEFYRSIHGIFLDEQAYDADETHLQYYEEATRYAHSQGYWPVFANPGTNQIEPYFQRPTADVIVVHENEFYADEKSLRGDYFGGHADYPSYRRASLVHSMKSLDEKQIQVMAKYTRWIYVTEDMYQANTPGAENPWDSLSVHTEKLLELLDR